MQHRTRKVGVADRARFLCTILCHRTPTARGTHHRLDPQVAALPGLDGLADHRQPARRAFLLGASFCGRPIDAKLLALPSECSGSQELVQGACPSPCEGTSRGRDGVVVMVSFRFQSPLCGGSANMKLPRNHREASAGRGKSLGVQCQYAP
jgi:hypothetical protein